MTTTIETGAPLFARVQDALTFAMHYAHDQSPRTPMQRLVNKGSIGSGKGLIGLDGAHQAGAIMQLLKRELSAVERAILVVRFGDVRITCPCCGNDDAATTDWREAVDTVSHHVSEIADLHPKIRHAIVEKVVCRRKMVRVTSLSSRYEVSERTVRERMRKAKPVLAALENRAVGIVNDMLQGRGVVEMEAA